MATGTQLEKNAAGSPGQLQTGGRLAGLWGLAQVRWAQMAAAQRGWAMVAALLLAALDRRAGLVRDAPRLAHALRRSRPGRRAADRADPGAGADSV